MDPCSEWKDQNVVNTLVDLLCVCTCNTSVNKKAKVVMMGGEKEFPSINVQLVLRKV